MTNPEKDKEEFYRWLECTGNLTEGSRDAIWEYFEKRRVRAIEEAEWRGRNEYYFDSPEHLTDEAVRLSATLQQRLNYYKEVGYLSKLDKASREELVRVANKLVSVTRKIRNCKPLSD